MENGISSMFSIPDCFFIVNILITSKKYYQGVFIDNDMSEKFLENLKNCFWIFFEFNIFDFLRIFLTCRYQWTLPDTIFSILLMYWR